MLRPATNKTCQSCGMPMNNYEDYGTKSDTSKNMEYCKHCYENGEFTSDLPLDEFTEKQIKLAQRRGIPEPEARRTAYDTLRKLNRWKK